MGLTSSKPPPFAIPVAKIGEYKVVKPLGQGAFGQVYHVENASKQEFALKQINCGSLDSALQALMEATLLKQLNHPAIVKFYEIKTYEHQGRSAAIIVMELVKGISLETFLQHAPSVDLQLVMTWFITLLEGLQYMHSKKIVHRDLKPANIMITEDGGLKIVDLGISQVMTKDYLSTIAGTPKYMAPEMLTQQTYDARVDLWSLGCILWEAVSSTKTTDPMVICLARDPNLLENTIEDMSIRWILSQMLTEKDKRLTADQLLKSDVIQGWKALLSMAEKKIEATSVSPPTMHFLLPFLSCLGPRSLELRAAAIGYLTEWLKIGAVQKAIAKRGVEPLCRSLEVMEEQPSSAKPKMSEVLEQSFQKLLTLTFMSDICGRPMYMHQCVYQLLIHGGVCKAVQLCYTPFATSNTKHMTALLKFLSRVLPYPQVYAAVNEEVGVEHLMRVWLSSSGVTHLGALSLYSDLPLSSHDEPDMLVQWCDGLTQVGKAAINLSALCQNRLEPHLLLNTKTLGPIKAIIDAAAMDQNLAMTLIRLLRPAKQWIQQASVLTCCTADITGTAYTAQYFFNCVSCWPDFSKGCCLSCMRTCHRGHKIKKRPVYSKATYCDCQENGKCISSSNRVAGGFNRAPAAVLKVEPLPAIALCASTRQDTSARVWYKDPQRHVRQVELACPPGAKAVLYQPVAVDVNYGTPNKGDNTAFYFEVKIMALTSRAVAIGFSQLLDVGKASLPGLSTQSWGYHSDDGKAYANGKSKEIFGPPYSVGDIIGCGLTHGGSVYYTINGFYLGVAFDLVLARSASFATIGIMHGGKSKVEIVTGKDLLFDHQKILAGLYEGVGLELNPYALSLLVPGTNGVSKYSPLLLQVFTQTVPQDMQAHILFALAQSYPEEAKELLAMHAAHLNHSASSTVKRLVYLIKENRASAMVFDVVPAQAAEQLSPGSRPRAPSLATHRDTPTTPTTPIPTVLSSALPQVQDYDVVAPELNIRSGPGSPLTSAIQRRDSNGPQVPAAFAPEPAFSKEDLQSAVAAHLRDSGLLASIIANSTTSRSMSQSQMMTMSKRLVPVTGWTAANPDDRRELVLEDRTMKALLAEFAIVFEDLLTDSKSVKVVEKVTVKGRTKIANDRSVAVLQSGDELCFLLV